MKHHVARDFLALTSNKPSNSTKIYLTYWFRES